ncbi:hypothetical protein L204_103529 [Cryptococcus depauperatus]|nr:hypothetical protein L204_01845 [Cryptococcus depauperatus CBS 7855]
MIHSPAPDAVLHLAALHTLAATGFASTSKAASMTLSTVLTKYLRLVAEACVERANLSGRSKVVALDVAEALKELGIHVGELTEWAEEQGEVVFRKEEMGNFENYLRDGLTIDEEIAQLQLIPEEQVDLEEVFEDEDEVLTEETDDVHIKSEPEDLHVEELDLSFMQHHSPVFSWLPLPTGEEVSKQSPLRSLEASPPPAVEIAAPHSIADRYRRSIPYSSSQLSEARPFFSPETIKPVNLPPSTSSLRSLLSTYTAIASDPSVSLRQNDLRRQAADLVRRSIAPVDVFMPQDTLSASIPPVRATPIVPSHSDVLPPKLIPVNPHPDGALSLLIQHIVSPYLPPQLRERLTGLRPPIAQMRNGEPVLYGPAVRGPDGVTLSKARGKYSEEGQNEVFLRRTWNSGARGAEKYGRRILPLGRKVVRGQEGEPIPRTESHHALAIKL